MRMKKNIKFHNESGISLMEIMIVVALLAIVSVAFMDMSRNMNNLQSDMQRKQDETELRAEILTVLNKEDFCSVSLAGLNPATNPVTFVKNNIDGNPATEGLNMELFYKTGASRTKKFSATDTNHNTYGKIKIESIKLQMNNGTGSNYAASTGHTDVGTVLVSYSRLNNPSMPRKTLDFTVNVSMKTVGVTTTILSCRVQPDPSSCAPLGLLLDSTTGLCRNPSTTVQGNMPQIAEGRWGGWGSTPMCSNGRMVCGLMTRIEGGQGGGDDTAMNAIRLTCCNNNPVFGVMNMQVLSTNNENGWGDWGFTEYCPAGSYVRGYQFRMEGSQGGGDDTAGNAIRLICSDPGATSLYSSQSGWGGWGGVSYCPSNQYACGFQTRNEGGQGGGDDTALNGIRIRCCSVNPP